MTIREGKWKCTYCDELNRGRDLKCLACGATREKDVEFIYDENAAEITDQAELDRVRVGTDWLCETCGASNSNDRDTCKQCSAPKGSSRNRDVKMVQPPAPPPPPPSPPSKILPKILATLGIFALFLIMLTFYLTRTREATLTVSGVEWQRTVDVEELQTQTKQGWVNDLPKDARILSRRSEVHHTEKIKVSSHSVEKTVQEKVKVGTKKVKTGTKDLGNGYFEDVYKDEPVYETRSSKKIVEEPVYQERPVYQDKATYQVDRWEKVRTEKTEGKDNSPQWPQVNEGSKLRSGKRTEKYMVSFSEAKTGKTYQQEVKADEFSQYKPGTNFKANINKLDTIKNLSLQK